MATADTTTQTKIAPNAASQLAPVQNSLPGGGVALNADGSIKTQATPTPAPTSPVGMISSLQGAEHIDKASQTLSKLSAQPPASTAPTGSASGASDTPVKPGDVNAKALASGKDYIKFINPNTGQTSVVYDPAINKSQVDSFLSQGYQPEDQSISQSLPFSINGSKTTPSSQANAELAADKATVDNLSSRMNQFMISDADLKAQTDTITKQWDNRIQQMQDVNQRREQSISTLGVRLGDRYTGSSGGMFGGIISEEERQGVQRIADLESQKQAAIAAARLAANTQNWTVFAKQVDTAQKTYEDKLQAIKDLNAATLEQNKFIASRIDAFNQNERENIKLDLQAKMDDHTISYQDKQLQLNSAQLDETTRHNMQGEMLTKMMDDHTISYQDKQQVLAQAQLSETERHNKQAELVARETALKGVYNRDADGTIYDTRTGKVVATPGDSMPIGAVTPGRTGDSIVDANTKYSSTGVPYIDGTNLSGAQSTKAQLIAAKAGIPFLAKEGATGMTLIEEARANAKLMSEYVGRLATSDTANAATLGAWGYVKSGFHKVEGFTQVGPGAQDVTSYESFRQAAIKNIQAMAAGGSGLRITAPEIDSYMRSIPSDSDTASIAAGKLAVLNSLLTNNEKGLVGTQAFDQYNPKAAASDVQTYYKASPEHAKQIESIMQAQPGLTDSQLMQIVQP